MDTVDKDKESVLHSKLIKPKGEVVTWEIIKNVQSYLNKLAPIYYPYIGAADVEAIVDKVIDTELILGSSIDINFIKHNCHNRLKQFISRNISNKNQKLELTDYIDDSNQGVRQGFGDPEKEILKENIWQVVEDILKKDERDAHIVRLHIAEGYTFAEIGHGMGLTPQGVSQRYQKALKTIADALTIDQLR